MLYIKRCLVFSPLTHSERKVLVRSRGLKIKHDIVPYININNVWLYSCH